MGVMHTKLENCTCMWLVITWYGGKNCTKLVLKPLAAKNGCFVSVLCIGPFH